MASTYTTVAALKSRIAIPDTIDDLAIAAAVATVSREIDRYCGRRFYVETATRYFDALDGGCLRVDDLLSVTSIKTDSTLDRTYATTWAATDYELDPPNALSESPPEPYTRILVKPLGTNSFRTGDRRGNQVVGIWGYYDVRETVSSLLNEALDTSETGVDVVDGTLYDVGQTLLIDSEQMEVTAIASNTLTVGRAVNGTTAAAHSNGATIQRYTYPVVGEACLQQAILMFRSYNATFGEIGGNEGFTQSWRQSVGAGLHPFVKAALESFRRLEAG